jgi:hypothetical protein
MVYRRLVALSDLYHPKVCVDLNDGDGLSFVLYFGFLALPLSRSPLCLVASGEPIAFAVHLQDVDMMGEPVEQGAGEPFRAEYTFGETSLKRKQLRARRSRYAQHVNALAP